MDGVDVVLLKMTLVVDGGWIPVPLCLLRCERLLMYSWIEIMSEVY